MVVEDTGEFQEGQRVRVRQEGGNPATRPDRRLGQLGIARYGTGSDHRGRTILYYVEFDGGEVEPISPDWLEPA